MRITAFAFIFLLSSIAWAQNPMPDTIFYLDKFGIQKKAPVAYLTEILVVDGYSMYTMPDQAQLEKTIERRGGFTIINNPDSVSAFLRKRIKAVFILNSKKKQ